MRLGSSSWSWAFEKTWTIDVTPRGDDAAS
jgi:hypothetical protein